MICRKSVTRREGNFGTINTLPVAPPPPLPHRHTHACSVPLFSFLFLLQKLTTGEWELYGCIDKRRLVVARHALENYWSDVDSPTTHSFSHTSVG